MNESGSRNLWRRWYDDVVCDDELPPDAQHVMDDDVLVEEWQQGRLSSEVLSGVIEHLDRCRDCRAVAAAMLRSGAWGDEDAEGGSSGRLPHDDRSLDARRVRRYWFAGARRTALIGTALVATVLLAVGLWTLRPGERGRPTELAALEQLVARDPERALAALERLANERSNTAEQRQISALAERAAYRAARRQLHSRALQAVTALTHRAERLGARSGRLANLRLQAERGESAEISLATDGMLTRYGFMLSGRSAAKSLDGLAPPTPEEAALKKALQEFPRSVPLRLNLGQMLLARRAPEAAAQFRAVLEIAPDNMVALVGLGLAHYLNGETEQAKDAFQRAVELDPQHGQAQLNLAITLERLGRHEAARPHFRQAYRRIGNESLKQQIEQLLGR